MLLGADQRGALVLSDTGSLRYTYWQVGHIKLRWRRYIAILLVVPSMPSSCSRDWAHDEHLLVAIHTNLWKHSDINITWIICSISHMCNSRQIWQIYFVALSEAKAIKQQRTTFSCELCELRYSWYDEAKPCSFCAHFLLLLCSLSDFPLLIKK